MTASRQRLAWVIVTFGLLAGLIGLDSWRGGPASTLSRCNLALSRSSGAPADVLVVGSSRLGTAVDPVALEAMLGAEPGSGGPTAERLALGRSPLRANVALVENYLTNRGDPAVIVLELSFLTGRTVDRLATVDPGLPADAFLFRRDLNLMGYRQIMTMPAVAMPFTERETAGNRLRYAMRGAVSRSGALTYQFARRPLTGFSLEGCDRQAWTREPNWPGDFAFAWDESDRTGRPMERIEALRAEAARGAAGRPQGWQVGTAIDRSAPYDLGQR
jgi:hypothetical protein